MTAEWLTAVLRAGGHLGGCPRRRGRRLGRSAPGRCATASACALTYDGPTDAPAAMVAKLPAADETSRATAVALRSYEKEVRFYQELAADAPDRHADGVPRRPRPDDLSRFVLLLEDLAPAEQGDQLVGCTLGRGGRPRSTSWSACTRPGGATRAWPASSGCAATATTRTSDACRCCCPRSGTGSSERYDGRPRPPRPRGGRGAVRAPRRLPRARPAAPRPSSTATTGSTTCCFDRRRRASPASSTGRPAPSAPRCSDVAYFIGAGLAADDRRAARGRARPRLPPRRSGGGRGDGIRLGRSAGPTTGAAPSPACSWPWRPRCWWSAPSAATRCS